MEEFSRLSTQHIADLSAAFNEKIKDIDLSIAFIRSNTNTPESVHTIERLVATKQRIIDSFIKLSLKF